MSSASLWWNDHIELMITAPEAGKAAMSGRSLPSVATAPKAFTPTVSGAGAALPEFVMTVSTGLSASRATPFALNRLRSKVFTKRFTLRQNLGVSAHLAHARTEGTRRCTSLGAEPLARALCRVLRCSVSPRSA